MKQDKLKLKPHTLIPKDSMRHFGFFYRLTYADLPVYRKRGILYIFKDLGNNILEYTGIPPVDVKKYINYRESAFRDYLSPFYEDNKNWREEYQDAMIKQRMDAFEDEHEETMLDIGHLEKVVQKEVKSGLIKDRNKFIDNTIRTSYGEVGLE